MPKHLSLQQNILWNTFGSCFYLFCQWLTTVLVVRLAGYEEAGVLALAMSITSVMYSFALYGMRTYQISDIHSSFSDSSYIFSRVISGGTALVLCVIFCILMPYTIYQKLCVITYMIFKESEAMADVFNGIVQKEDRLDLVGQSNMLRGIIMLVTFCGGLVITKSLLFSVILMAIGTLIVVFAFDMRKTLQLVSVKWSFLPIQLKNLFIECFPLVSSTFLLTLIAFVPRYYLERILGSENLGIYASIASPTLIVQAMALLVFTPLVPLFTKAYNAKDNKGFLLLLFKCIAFLVIVGVAAMLGAQLIGKPVYVILLGTEIAEHIYLLLPIVVCTILTATIWLLNSVFTAMRRLKEQLLCAAMGLAVVCFSSSLAIERFGINGTSTALIASQVTQLILMSVLLICFISNNRREA